ncbi:hypothetical protein T439DRAFT_245323 [Meredithblackwellia eburnea MCA 4105]
MTKWKWKSKSESKSKSKPLETEPIKSETELAWERGEEWRPEPKFANLSPPNKRQTTINPATLFMTILYPPAVIFPILGDIASHRLGSGGNLDSKSGSSTPTSSTEAKAKQGRVVKEIVDGIIIYENPEDRNSHETPRAVGVKSTVSASDSSFPKMGHDAPTPNETSMVAEARANEASARKNVPTKDLIIGYGFIGAVLAGLYWLVRVVGGALNGNVSSPASGATAESHQKSNGIAAWLIISAVVLCFLACLGNSSVTIRGRESTRCRHPPRSGTGIEDNSSEGSHRRGKGGTTSKGPRNWIHPSCRARGNSRILGSVGVEGRQFQSWTHFIAPSTNR